MVIFRYKLGYLALMIFLLIISSGMTFFSALMSSAVIFDFSLAGFTGWLLMFLVGFVGIYGSVSGAIKLRITAPGQDVVVGSYGPLGLSFPVDELVGFNMFMHRTKFKAYRAFVIEATSGVQAVFIEMQLSDFDAARDAVKTLLPRNALIKRRFLHLGGVKTSLITWLLIAGIYTIVFVAL